MSQLPADSRDSVPADPVAPPPAPPGPTSGGGPTAGPPPGSAGSAGSVGASRAAENPPAAGPSPATPEAVNRCQAILAHAWMVRTFVKHSPEAEEFPELLELPRAVFDLSRALETRVADPAGYFRMLDKKLLGLRRASDQFAHDAPLASVHTNFQQAVISIATCVTDLEKLLARHHVRPVVPPSPRPSGPRPGHSPASPVPGVSPDPE